jgi:hypothetical protein
MNASNSTKKVLFIGQQPETVDFFDPALPPGFGLNRSSMPYTAPRPPPPSRSTLRHKTQPRQRRAGLTRSIRILYEYLISDTTMWPELA